MKCPHLRPLYTLINNSRFLCVWCFLWAKLNEHSFILFVSELWCKTRDVPRWNEFLGILLHEILWFSFSQVMQSGSLVRKSRKGQSVGGFLSNVTQNSFYPGVPRMADTCCGPSLSHIVFSELLFTALQVLCSHTSCRQLLTVSPVTSPFSQPLEQLCSPPVPASPCLRLSSHEDPQ